MATKHLDPRTFTTQRSLGYLLKMCHSLMVDAGTAALAGHELSFIQWIVLMKLREGSAVTASTLCRDMRHDNGALTRLLDQLEDRGLVERKRSESDRRVVNLELTAAGRRKVTELLPPVVDTLNDILADFSKAEFAELVRLLSKLMDRLKAYEHTPDEAAS